MVNNNSYNNRSTVVSTVGKDAYAYSLGYYQGDYKPISGSGAPAFSRSYTATFTDLTGKNLYNGNIGNATYAIQNINSGQTTGYTYGYDQLNRLKRMRQHNLGGNTGNWDALSISNSYAEDFNYDANGNILNLQRKNGTGALMDNLTYGYNYSSGNLQNNRLNSVTDAAGVVNSSDIGSSSYSYDAIGNLTSDTQAGISNIDWTVYGKIKGISKTGGNVAYSYDAGGNRVSKAFGGITTYYVRDAQGNPLAVYEQTGSTTTWKEQQLYGSSRLGMWKPDIDLATATGNNVWGLIGTKSYELTNHLGNVLAVVSDKRVAVSGGGYEAEVLSANDYYSFGMAMSGRTWTLSDAYRYGFNGKENDKEVKGDGNQQDYGMRIYDPRLGRFLSTDPIASSYPMLTTYQFASNTPIQAIDLDGLEAFYVHGTWSNPATYSKLSITTINEITGNTTGREFGWTGNNTNKARMKAAKDLANHILKYRDLNQPLTIVGHSHGGNVAIMAANILQKKGIKVDNIITINTPSREYQLNSGATNKHVQIYQQFDPVQGFAGNSVNIPDGANVIPMSFGAPIVIPTFNGSTTGTGEIRTNISRTFDDAINIGVPFDENNVHNSHNTPDLWKDRLNKAINPTPIDPSSLMQKEDVIKRDNTYVAPKN